MDALFPVLIGVVGVLFYLSFKFLVFTRKNEFSEIMRYESERCLRNQCEVDSNWNPHGRIYTNGFMIEEKNGKTRFVKQAKLCDLGILN